MIDKIKSLGFILQVTFKLILAYVLLLPALLVCAFVILIITFDFQTVRGFSSDCELTYILKGKAFQDAYKLIKKGRSKA